MSKRGIQESNFIFNKDLKGKCVAHKNRLPIIKCVCGFKILVVPDLKAMDRAITNHVAEHKKSNDGSERLTDFLIEQVLILAAN